MRGLIFYSFFIGLATGYAQRIVDFNLFQAGTSVLVKFSIEPGPSCSGYTILHSIDSTFFTTILDEPSICGVSPTKEDKSFSHTSPGQDKINYYKVQLSFVETSPIKRIYVPSSRQSGIIAYPNPVLGVTDSLKLRLYNTANLNLVGFLYSPSGRPRQELHLKSSGEYTSISTNGLDNGLYIVWLTDGYQAYSTKFIVLK